MTDYISREAAIELGKKQSCAGIIDGGDFCNISTNMLRNIPAADVVEVVHGEWINAYPDIEPNPMFMYGICSQCGFEQNISDKLNYCPNCGAKMDGGADDGRD